MIAVAPDQALELAIQVGASLPSRRLSSMHQHAEPVAGVEQFGRRRVVRRAIGVAAHLLQLLDAEFLQPVRQGRADAGVVLVIAGAFET